MRKGRGGQWTSSAANRGRKNFYLFQGMNQFVSKKKSGGKRGDEVSQIRGALGRAGRRPEQ